MSLQLHNVIIATSRICRTIISQISDLRASVGWLNRFNERHNISLRFIQGESNDVDTKTVKEQKAKINSFFLILL